MTSFPTYPARYVHFDLEVDKDLELVVSTLKWVSSDRKFLGKLVFFGEFTCKAKTLWGYMSSDEARN